MVEKTTGEYTITIVSANEKEIINFKEIGYPFSEIQVCYSIILKSVVTNTIKRINVVGNRHNSTTITNKKVYCSPEHIIVGYENEVSCFSIPELSILWQTKVDEMECFEVVPYKNEIIAHGGHSITRLNADGKIVWQRNGLDLFLTPNNSANFFMDNDFVVVRDWRRRKYIFNFNGDRVKPYSIRYVSKRLKKMVSLK